MHGGGFFQVYNKSGNARLQQSGADFADDIVLGFFDGPDIPGKTRQIHHDAVGGGKGENPEIGCVAEVQDHPRLVGMRAEAQVVDLERLCPGGASAKQAQQEAQEI